MMIRNTLIALGLVASAGLALAQDTAQPVAGAASGVGHAREKHQDKRIERGMAQGDLSQREAKRLKMEQRAIDHRQRKAKADGVVTPQEQARLDRMQDRASKDIARQRHDAASGAPLGK
jgi:hypothetical protein